MRKIFTIIFTLTLVLGTAVPCFAAENSNLVDGADILTVEEENKLIVTLDEISERQQFDVVIVTVPAFTQTDVETAAENYYDENGYGYGEENDGIILYISMAERDVCITSTGYGTEAFSDMKQESMLEEITPELSEGNYYGAFEEFAQLSDEQITVARSSGEGGAFLFFLIVGFIVAKLVVRSHKKKLRTVNFSTQANEYMKDGSLVLTNKKEIYLYSNTTRRKIEKSDPNVKTSSGGNKHRSTSGKF